MTRAYNVTLEQFSDWLRIYAELKAMAERMEVAAKSQREKEIARVLQSHYQHCGLIAEDTFARLRDLKTHAVYTEQYL